MLFKSSAFFFAFASVTSVFAAPTSLQANFIVFGNSLSDVGNSAALSNTEAYWKGRYSNSYVWNEYASDLLDLKLENHAYGGATSNNDISPAEMGNITIPSFRDQVTTWLSENPSPSSYNLKNDIIQVEIGGNDILHRLTDFLTGEVSVEKVSTDVAQSISEDIQRLVDAGYKNVFLWNLPMVERTPIANSVGVGALIKPLVTGINDAIADAVNDLISKNSAKTDGIRLFDLYNLMGVALEPEVLKAVGVTDSTTSCVPLFGGDDAEACSDPDAHLFYDSVHPASRMHYLWGVVSAMLTRDPNHKIDVKAALEIAKTFDIANSNSDNNIIADGIAGPEESVLPPSSTEPRPEPTNSSDNGEYSSDGSAPTDGGEGEYLTDEPAPTDGGEGDYNTVDPEPTSSHLPKCH